MAYLKQALEPNEVKSLTVANVKKKYNELAVDYNKLINLDYVYCPCCGDFKARSNFYASTKSKSGLNHAGCKSCLLEMATDLVDKKTNERKDNRDKAIETLRKMDLPFVEETYQAQVNSLADNVNEKQRGTAWSQYIVMIQSLPNWRNQSFKDSVFSSDDLENNTEEQQRIIQKTVRAAKKRFGSGYSDSDYQELEDEYQSWCSRVEVATKAQEEVVENLSIIKLLKRKALLEGKPTDKLDKQQQDWLDAGNLKPKQNSGNGYADTLTFGQLIEKWENEDPIPEPDPELADVDNIGKLIRIWFSSHLRRVLGLDGGYNKEYDEYVAQYTVDKPTYAGVDEEGEDNDVYAELFGRDE